MKDEIIDLDSEFGKQIGFTSDNFFGYLWRAGDRVLLSAVMSKHPGRGNFSKLLTAIESHGLKVAVPCPFPIMQQILKKKGFVPHFENHPEGGQVDVWERPRPN